MREREREKERERESERERERARARERERERERERKTEYKNQAKKITPTIFPFVDSGPISLGFSRESPARDSGASSGREREREKERERRREYLAGSYYLQWDENCITYVFTRQFSRVLTPGHSSLGFSREIPAWDMWYYVAYVYNGELVFPSWGINELEFSRQNQKFSSSYP